MAGLRVRVLERRGVVGGACVTEEFHPGFRNSTAAYTVGLLQPEIIRDLKLHEHGLRIVNRRAQNFLPLPDGRHLLTGEGRTEREIAKFSVRDAARYGDYQVEIGRVADVLRSLVLRAPPSGRATGIVLEDGTPIRARAVIANVDPQRLFQTLLPPETVPRAVAARMRTWKAGLPSGMG
jgi:phytoene dehydrogenase-like protein